MITKRTIIRKDELWIMLSDKDRTYRQILKKKLKILNLYT